MITPQKSPRLMLPAVVMIMLLPTSTALSAQQSPAKPVSFHNDVHPILQRKCQGCHQPAKANGKLVLTSFDHLMKGGEGGAVVEPGKADESPLVDQISGNPPAMPKNSPPLSPKEIEVIKRWIAEGAKDDT